MNSADFDIIIANLPYVDKNWDFLTGVDREPELALYAENGGLATIFEFLTEINKQSAGQNSENRKVLLEADPCQHAKIIDFAAKNSLKHEKTSGFWLVFSKNV